MRRTFPIALALISFAAACTSDEAPRSASTPSVRAGVTHRLEIDGSRGIELVGATEPSSGLLGPVFDLFFTDRGSQIVIAHPSDQGAVIQRRPPGTATWTTSWQATADDTELRRLVDRSDGSLVVFGLRERDPIMLTSTDDGLTWHLHQADVPAVARAGWWGYAFQVADGVLVASTDIALNGPSGPTIQSTDGGLTWRLAPMPGTRATGLTLLDAAHRLAWTRGGGHGCATRPAVTFDGGITWRRTATCLPVTPGATTFVTDLSGYAGGGVYDQAMGRGHVTLFRTDDAGLTWRRIWRGEGGPSIARLVFADERHGWMIQGGCSSMGADGPCVGGVMETRDGGRSWSPGGPKAYRLALDPAEVPWVAGAPIEANSLWHLAQDGAAWIPILPEGATYPWKVAAHGETVIVRSWLGTYRMVDGGTSWRRVSRFPRRHRDGKTSTGGSSTTMTLPKGIRCAERSHPSPSIEWLACGDSILLTTDGRTWVQMNHRGLNAQWISAIDGREAWMIAGWPEAVWHTVDGGRTWADVGFDQSGVPIPEPIGRS